MSRVAERHGGPGLHRADCFVRRRCPGTRILRERVWKRLTDRALHDAVRIGLAEVIVHDMTNAVARTSGARMVEAMRDHAAGWCDGEWDRISDVAERFTRFGSPLLAAEASAQSAESHDDAHARRAVVRARLWTRRAPRPPPRRWPVSLENSPDANSRWPSSLRLASSRGIAEKLFLSARTVDNHLASVFRKLELAGRDQVAAVLGPALAVPSAQQAGRRLNSGSSSFQDSKRLS